MSIRPCIDPAPRQGQGRLTILGSPHLANPGNDEHNTDVDDMLTPERQRELTTVCDRLEAREFDNVAVEIPRDRQATLNEQYEPVRTGLNLDADAQFPDGPARIRGEAVQIGFRLARRLGLTSVHAVDSQPTPPDIDADWAIDVPADDVPYPVPNVDQLVDDEQQRLRTADLLDVLRSQNDPTHLRSLQAVNIAAALSSTEDDGYTGSKQLGFWYERNARLLENLRRTTGPDEETLFIVGASHVCPISQLARADPQSCPRSPLPLLR